MSTTQTTGGTAGLFHTDKNGNPGKCEASKEPCPLGDGGHFDTAEDARDAYEAANDPFADPSMTPPSVDEIEYSKPFKKGVTDFSYCGVATAVKDDGSEITVVKEFGQPVEKDEDGFYPDEVSELGDALWEASGGDENEWDEMSFTERTSWVSDRMKGYEKAKFHNKNGIIGFETENLGTVMKKKDSNSFRIVD